MGQLLVVKYFKLASNYQRPELLPGPILVVVRKINFNPDPRALKRVRQ